MLLIEQHKFHPSTLTGGTTSTLSSSESISPGRNFHVTRQPFTDVPVRFQIQPDVPKSLPELIFGRINQDPKVCMGKPTIQGTRITAEFAYRLVESGMQIKEILDAYPQLEEEDIRQAIAFTHAQLGVTVP